MFILSSCYFFSQSDVSSFSQAFRLLIREEGLGALFRGWLPTVLR